MFRRRSPQDHQKRPIQIGWVFFNAAAYGTIEHIIMSFLFLTFGPTHSGKTTFGKKLRAVLGDPPRFIHVDNDEVDGFVKEHFNNLRTDPEILATRTPSNPDLRLLIPQLIANYAFKEDYSVIATAAHPKHVIRESYYEIARKNKAKIVLVIF